MIIIVYDVAIKHCKFALDSFKEKQSFEKRAKHIYKVQDAVSELMSALNMEAGGDIAKSLYRLYDYMIRRLIYANTQSEAEPIEEVLGYMLELRETWEKAIGDLKKSQGAIKPGTPAKKFAISG